MSLRKKPSHGQKLLTAPSKLLALCLVMSLLNGCGELTLSSSKQEQVNKDNIPNGCEWVKPVTVPEPVVTYSLQTGQSKWLYDNQTNNENILDFCYKKKVEQDKPELDLNNLYYDTTPSKGLSLSGSI